MVDDRAADSSGELAAAVERLIGRELDGRYRVEGLLGHGGMGAVLRARHRFLDEDVAVKVLRPRLARDPAAARRFAREARGTCSVDSEHAVKITDFGATADGLLYMVLELLDGHTVAAELAREGRLGPRRAVHVARQVAHALAAAHRVGLVHRDLKPENVMLVRRGGDPDFVKVLDFGLVKVMEGAGERALSMAALTQGDIVFGTPDYMAPEQALGQPLDGRADLYALGVTLFEMVAGRPPFVAASELELLVAHVRQPAPRLREHGAVDGELDELVARLLEKDREARPASAEAVAEVLGRVGDRLTGGAARSALAQTVDLPALSLAPSASPMPTPNPSPSPSPFPTPSPSPSPPPTPSPSPSPSHVPVSQSVGPEGPGDEGQPAGPSSPASLRSAYALGERRAGRARRVHAILLAATALGIALAAFVLVGVLSGRGPFTRPVTTVVDARPTGPAEAPLPAAVVAPLPVDAGTAALAVDAAALASPGPGPDARRPRPPPSPPSPSTTDPRLASHLAAAEAARRAGNSLKQLAEADQALALDGRSARARYLMGDALVTTGDLANGCRYLRSARRMAAAAARARAAGCPAAAD